MLTRKLLSTNKYVDHESLLTKQAF